jgi:hypothetical protein
MKTEKHLLRQIRDLAHKVGNNKPLLPNPELPQDLALLAHVLEARQERIRTLEAQAKSCPASDWHDLVTRKPEILKGGKA